MKKLKFLLVVFTVFFINPIHGYQDTIKVELNDINTLKLSKIAESLESIVLEIPPEKVDRQFVDLAINEDFIFAVTMNQKEPINSRLLQFQRNGKFVREIGKTTNGSNSLFFDDENKIIGINNDEKILQYDFKGNFLREIKAFGENQIVHKGRLYAVAIHFPALGEPVEYSLIQSDEIGEEEKLLIEFQDNSKFTVGQHMRFSKHGTDLLLWNNVDHIFYKIERGQTTVKYELNISKGLKSRANNMIIGNWLVFPALNQRTRQNIIKFINLKSGESFDTLDQYDAGIIDDLSNYGFIRRYGNEIYGDVENKIFFLKDVSNIENIKGDYPARFKALLIATLK